ncbi:MAG: SRPBCC family protein [Acidobacteria bacterium]|nr:SRPBCC family protein [Acidobacteriota bacterium]
MRIEESFKIPLPIEKVWSFIADPERVASCLPSVVSFQMIDDRHSETVIKQKIGFISATFKIETEVLEKAPPFQMVLSNKGRTIAGAAGTMKSLDKITLNSVQENETEVRVTSDLTLGGPLAVLGAKLIEAKSKELFSDTSRRMKEQLGVLGS